MTSPTTGGGLSSPLIWLMSSDNPFERSSVENLATRSRRSELFLVAVSSVRSRSRIWSFKSAWCSLNSFACFSTADNCVRSKSVCCRLSSTSSSVLLAVCSAATSCLRTAVSCPISRLFSSCEVRERCYRSLGLGGERDLRVFEALLGGVRDRLGVLQFLLELVDLVLLVLVVSTIQFFDVVKTTVESARKSKEKAMITITRILPTKVMVPSYQSE